jgi:hypothetical protein
MRNILITILSLLVTFSSQADELCAHDNLNEYEFILSIEDTKEIYIAQIFLPDIKKTNGKFCGFWLHKELTNNIKHQYYGYKDSNAYISLNPEIYDSGLTINISNSNQWAQEGQLGKESYAGIIPVGKYKIVKK